MCKITSQSTTRKQASNIAKTEKESKVGLAIQSEVQRELFLIEELTAALPAQSQTKLMAKQRSPCGFLGKNSIFGKLSALTILPNISILKP